MSGPEPEVCWQCAGPEADDAGERLPGWCARCWFFYDRFGMRIAEPWRTCRVHGDLRTSCPHSGALA